MDSSLNSVTTGVYSYQTNGKNQNGGYTLIDQGQGETTVPTYSTSPEPTTMALLGGGLIGSALLRRKLAR